ncbi:MAG: hypothetical protein MJB14_06960, partial [Spirochaetes bacterium]|nr:hypothetical protein [Spirochaetota bacterium]
MKKIYCYTLITSLIIFVSFTLFANDTTTDLSQGNTEEISVEDTLEYGIEGEVVALLKELSIHISPDMFVKLDKRYQSAMLDSTKTAFAQYYARCETIPQSTLDYLYADAQDEYIDQNLKKALYYTIAHHGSIREGNLLLKALDADNEILKKTAADALTKCKDQAIVEPILKRLEISDTSDDMFLESDLKSNLILTLGELGSDQASPYLRSVLEESTSEKAVIMYTMYALAKIGDHQSIHLIDEKLNSSEPRIQEYAAYAMSTFKSPDALPVLKKMLLHNNAKVRIYACQGLVLNQDHSTMDILIYKFKKDPANEVRKEALISMIHMGSAGLAEIKKLHEIKKFSGYYLGVIGQAVSKEPTAENVAFAIELYHEADKAGKEMLAKTIATSQSNVVDPFISLLLDSENYLLRLGGIKAVKLIKDSTLWPRIQSLADSDPVPSVRNNAKRMLDIHS